MASREGIMVAIFYTIALFVIGWGIVLFSGPKTVPESFQLGFSFVAAAMFFIGVLMFSGKIKRYKLDLPKKGLAYKVAKIYDADPGERIALLEVVRPLWISAFLGPWVVKGIPEEYFKEGEIIDFLIIARLKRKALNLKG